MLPPILRILTWLPKRVFLAHYVLWVNLSTPHCRLAEIDARCDRMAKRLFCTPRDQ